MRYQRGFLRRANAARCGQRGTLIGDLALGVRTEKPRFERAQVGAALGAGGVQGTDRAFHEVVQTLTAQVDESAGIAERGSGSFQTQAQRARLGV